MKVNWQVIEDPTKSTRSTQKQTKTAQETTQSNPNVLGRLGLAAVRSVDPITQLANAGIDLAGQGLNKLFGTERFSYGNAPYKVSDLLQQQLGIDPESTRPTSAPENFAQRLIETAPLSAALGGTSALLGPLVGSAIGTGVESAGFSKEAADVIQALADVGTNVTRAYKTGKIQRLKNPSSPAAKEAAKKLGPSYQESLYEAAKKSSEPSIAARRGAEWLKQPVRTSRASANPLNNAINNVEELLSTQVNSSVKNTVDDVIKTVQNKIYNGKIKPAEVIDLRRSINELMQTGKGQQALPYLQELKTGIQDFFTEYGLKNPAFFNKLKEADKITELANYKPLLTEVLTYPVKRQLGPGVAEFVDTILSPIDAGGRLLRAIVKRNPAAPKYYYNFVRSAIKNDPAGMTRAYNLLKDSFGSALGDVNKTPNINWRVIENPQSTNK